MTLETSVPDEPALAADLANVLSDLLDEYGVRSRMSRAVESSSFIEERLEAARRSLEAAESRLSAFQAGNRHHADSPELSREYRQLKREAEVQSTLWIELSRQLEIARVEEVRSRTSLEILDRARPPIRPSYPNKRLFVVLGAMFGLLVGLLYVAVVTRLGTRGG